MTGSAPLRVVLVGAGGMGRAWLDLLATTPSVRVVAVVDLDLDLAGRAVADAGIDEVVVAHSIGEAAAQATADAVVNVTVPVAHHPVTMDAFRAGLPVLSEKPVAATVAEAVSLAAASEAYGRLLMVSQSRRYLATLREFRDRVRELGPSGLASTRFSLAPRFGGFRDAMRHPLLVDMAIHPFDAARYVLDADPVAVYCESSNPSWSWYASDAAATAIFEMSNGVRYTYTGSWCSEGFETSWNGEWLVTGVGGSAAWDGETAPRVERSEAASAGSKIESRADAATRTDARESIAGALDEFVDALSTGRTPSGEVHQNLPSLAMVEAAVRSADTGRRVTIDEVLDDAYAEAVQRETDPAVRARLESWSGARAAAPYAGISG